MGQIKQLTVTDSRWRAVGARKYRRGELVLRRRTPLGTDAARDEASGTNKRAVSEGGGAYMAPHRRRTAAQTQHTQVLAGAFHDRSTKP